MIDEVRRILDEEAQGSDMPGPVHEAWDDYYKNRPGGPPNIASVYDSDAYLAQERAWELCVAFLQSDQRSISANSTAQQTGEG